MGIKNILCFGDSNTWGYDSASNSRLPYESRWCGIMAGELGCEYRVYEEGFGGRTACTDDNVLPEANGAKYLWQALATCMPLDLVIIMLGTNDSKVHLGQEAYSIAKGYEQLIQTVTRPTYDAALGKTPKLLIVAPTDILRNGAAEHESEFFDLHSAEKIPVLRQKLKALSEQYGCGYVDAGAITLPGLHDGVHLDKTGHALLGKALAAETRMLLGEKAI